MNAPKESTESCCHPPPADPRFARFGEAVWKYITKPLSGFFGVEISEDILPLAAEAGLCCRVPYDPESHGEEIDAEPGDEIWWWGDLDSTNAPSAGTAPESATSNPVESHGGPVKSDSSEGAVGLPRLVLRFLAGEWVRRYCGIGDRANEMNWLHVRWLGPQSCGLPVLWWGFGSAMIDERIVFQILQHPEEWEVSSQSAEVRNLRSKQT